MKREGAGHSRRAWRLVGGALLLALVAYACGTSIYIRPGLSPRCRECIAGDQELDARVVLIGDAGEPLDQTPNLELLSHIAAADPGRTLVLFLGDNIYPAGMPALDEGVDLERRDAEEVLAAQVEAVETAGAAAVFVPGNHDWNRSREGGMARVLALQDWLDAHAGERIRLQPRDACPGPIVIEAGRWVRVVVIDTEWLLTPSQRRRGMQACARGSETDPETYSPTDEAAFYRSLEQIVDTTGERYLLVASHHPIRTRGEHGGYVPLKYWLFPFTRRIPWLYIPLPLIYPPLRYGIVRSDQDLVGGRNREMVRELERIAATARSKPVVMAAGHDHNLQVIQPSGSDVVVLVSGSGSKVGAVGKNNDTIFRHAQVGLMVVDYFTDGRIALRVYEARGDRSQEPVFSFWLRSSKGTAAEPTSATACQAGDRARCVRSTRGSDRQVQVRAP